jgi:hypothetical protein
VKDKAISNHQQELEHLVKFMINKSDQTKGMALDTEVVFTIDVQYMRLITSALIALTNELDYRKLLNDVRESN